MVGKRTGKPNGRPPIVTAEVLQKLEDAFALDATDLAACFYANISPRTLYNYQQEHPEFIQRKELLKEKPVLKALNTMVHSLTDPNNARWYLEKKHPSYRAKQEVTHKIEIDPEKKQEIDKAIENIFE